nr:Ferric enterobactin transport system permeaseprotein FepG [Salmonella sp. NCTC 7297]
MALLIGAALGVSGAIFQSLMRNPLGSPDVMGFNTGAWSGVLVAMVLFGQHPYRDRAGGNDGRYRHVIDCLAARLGVTG